MDSSQKIFGVGVPKSGSNSLADALTVMGYSVIHFGREKFRRETDAVEEFSKNIAADKPAISGFKNFDAFVDSPVWFNYQRLATENENAKFILTYRDPAACAFSWVRMQHYLHRKILPDTAPQNFSEFKEMAEKHIDRVFEYFKHDTKRLLLLDHSDSDEVKWEHLAKFLNRPAPKKVFPHSFPHTQFMKRKHANQGRK